jgi:tellurite methyltransferase
MSTYYDDKYRAEGFFWGTKPTSMAQKVLQMRPPLDSPKLLDIGCGEGRDTIFFAQEGYDVTAFDLSAEGVEKTRTWARALELSADVFQADLTEFRLDEHFDVIFSSGTLQYIPHELRAEILSNYKRFTLRGGIHAFTVPVFRPDLPTDPKGDAGELDWHSGEILTHYPDWPVEFFVEQILEAESGIKFAVNRLVAREPTGQPFAG